MEYYLTELLKHSINLFSIMNPISAGAIMLSLVGSHPNANAEIPGIARKNTLAVFAGMLATILLGNLILDFFGISVASIKVIGGVVLFLMALNMVQGSDSRVNHSDKEQQHAATREDISVIPLGIPIIMGPGLIATLLSLRAQARDWQGALVLLVAILLCTLGSYLILRNMPLIKRALGENGMRVFTRIMGLIVGAMSAQFLLSGLKNLWASY